MKRKNPELKTQQEKALIKQYIAFFAAFVLFILAAILTPYLFNGSIKYFPVFLTPPFFYIGVSSIKHQVTIVRISGQRLGGSGAVFVGILMILGGCAQYIFALSTLLGLSTQTEWASFPIYDNLPLVQTLTNNYYHIEQSSTFFHVNTFDNIISWSNFQEIPLVVNEHSIIIAGSVGGEDEINLPLLSADIDTGNINWQTVVGSGHIASDGEFVYIQIPNEPMGGAAGIAAYGMTSGSKIWETTFDWKYANIIEYLAATKEYIIVQTAHGGKSGFYLLDPQTGEIQLFDDYARYFWVEAGTDYEWSGNSISANGLFNWETNLPTERYLYNRELAAPVVSGDLILVKNGHRAISPIVAVNKTNGAIIWNLDELVVSNIAVDGSFVYVLTENAELKALDMLTGRVLASAQLSPSFPEDFDFINNSILIAADKNVVAIYFQDRQQLSIFRFENPR